MEVYNDSSMQGLSILEIKKRLLSRMLEHLVPMRREERLLIKEKVKNERDYIVNLICQELHIDIEDFDPSYDEEEFNKKIIKNEAVIQWYNENPPFE